MVTSLRRLGRKGVILVMMKILEAGIDVSMTPNEWHFDLITQNGARLEVKFANATITKGRDGTEYERYVFNLQPTEKQVCDFVILVLNTPKGHHFYIIPIKDLSSRHISFNPFSRQRSKYDRFKDCWELISNPTKYKHRSLVLKGN